MAEGSIENEKSGWFIFACRLLFFVVAFFLVIFTVLFNLGGSNDTYKMTMEQYISELTGYQARINTFNAMTFFPDLGVDFADLELRLHPDDPDPIATADRVSLSFGFWDAAFSSGKVNLVNIRNFQALPGAFFDKAVEIRKASILDSGDGHPVFRIEGHIGADEVIAQTNMESSGGSSPSYSFGKKNFFSIDIGAAHLEAEIEGGATGATIRGIRASIDGNDALTGALDVSGRRGQSLRLSGEWVLPEHGTVLRPDLNLDMSVTPLTIDGTIASPSFYAADFGESSRLAKWTGVLAAALSSSRIPPVLTDNRVELALDELKDGDAGKGPLRRTFRADNAPFGLGPLHDFIAALPAALEKPAAQP